MFSSRVFSGNLIRFRELDVTHGKNPIRFGDLALDMPLELQFVEGV